MVVQEWSFASTDLRKHILIKDATIRVMRSKRRPSPDFVVESAVQYGEHEHDAVVCKCERHAFDTSRSRGLHARYAIRR